MFNPRWVILAGLVSFSSFGAVSFKEKQMRVQNLMDLQKHAPAIAFEAYQRELGYEARGLSLDDRASIETNLLAEKIRSQVQLAFEAALIEQKSPELAREEVKAAIESDLEYAAPELKEELLNFSLETLNNAEAGAVNSEVDLSQVQSHMKKQVVAREQVLNEEGSMPLIAKANTSKDSEKKDYASAEELMQSLVSDKDSSRWISSSNQTIKTAEVVKSEVKISMEVKMEFLGASIEGGPSISFKREISTDAIISSEGLHPVIISGGNFDVFKRDEKNAILMKNGNPVKRYISFICDAEMSFETEYAGGGGFKYFGMGAETSVSKKFQNSVNLQSRRVALPESVAQKTMTVAYLSRLCHTEFLKTKYNNNMTVQQSLNTLMKSVISGLVFSHPKTKCAQDSQCKNWFNKEQIAFKRKNNTYRCVEDAKDKFRGCELRGKVNQKCSVYENKKRVSQGINEVVCDKGLKCVTQDRATFVFGQIWTYATGFCQK